MRLRAASQNKAVSQLLWRQGFFLVFAQSHFTADFFAFAAAASAVLAAIGQRNVLRNARLQDGLIGGHFKTAAARLDGDFVTHDEIIV